MTHLFRYMVMTHLIHGNDQPVQIHGNDQPVQTHDYLNPNTFSVFILPRSLSAFLSNYRSIPEQLNCWWTKLSPRSQLVLHTPSWCFTWTGRQTSPPRLTHTSTYLDSLFFSSRLIQSRILDLCIDLYRVFYRLIQRLIRRLTDQYWMTENINWFVVWTS